MRYLRLVSLALLACFLLLLPLNVAAADPSTSSILWNEANKYVGQTQTVCGPVVETSYRTDVNGRPTWLNIGRPFPDISRFQVIIWGKNRPNFPDAPERLYSGQTICVRGLITSYQGVAQIEVTVSSQVGQPRRDEGDYTQAPQQNSKDLSAYNKRGIAYGEQGQYEQAIQEFTQAIQLDPKNAAPYYNRGHTYAKLEQHQQAIQDYTQAVQLDPNNSIGYYHRGLSFTSLGQHERAIQEFTLAIRLSPKDPIAHNSRGIAYAALEAGPETGYCDWADRGEVLAIG